MSAPAALPSSPQATKWALIWFGCCLAFHLWGVSVGWQSRNLPGQEFRQTQTALSAYFIQQERDFSLAYPTPVLGPPWSIPMEFPLYQWTVVLTSDLTGWGLTKAGRAVSIGCFYLTLPAVYLLLAWWRVAPGRRWLVLAVIVTCPFYIFFARAFLMETMALMFSAWFAVGYSRAVEGRHWLWLTVAVLAGVAAALVKVTTLMVFLLPLICWTIGRWRRARPNWWIELGWIAGAVALPVVAAWWWTWHADGIKERNPLAEFLLSGNLTEFTLGSARTRFSAGYWAMKWSIVRDELTWLPLFGISLLGFVAGRGRLLSAAVLCVGTFAVPLAIFPVLYALHSYYYVANLLWLLLAAGLGLVALSESSRSRVVVAMAVAGICVGQAGYYLKHYYPVQSPISPGGDGVTRTLRQVTRPEEVVVITGQDWSSIIPFYARRRAMMLRSDHERTPAVVEHALENLLANGKVGALLVTGSLAPHTRLIERLARAGLSRTPVLFSRDIAIFLRTDRLQESLSAFEASPVPEVQVAPGIVLPRATEAPPPFNHRGEWVDVATLPPYFQQAFDGMRPRPVRIYLQYGISVERAGGVYRFGAHPVTRLVFELPAGPHRLQTRVWFSRDAWRDDLSVHDKTDGVGLRVSRLGSGGGELIFTHHVDPVARPADRGPLGLSIEFQLAQKESVEIAIDPGPAGSSVRDWVSLDRITFDQVEKINGSYPR